MARLRSVFISPVFRKPYTAVGEGGLGSAALFEKYCWKFIRASWRVLGDSFYCIYDAFSCNINVWKCISPWVSKEVLWRLPDTSIVGSGVLKMLLYCLLSRSLIFLLFGSKFPPSTWRSPIPALIVELFFTNLYPEWPHRQCVGLSFRRSHVRISVSAVSLVICSPHWTMQYLELRGYCPV